MLSSLDTCKFSARKEAFGFQEKLEGLHEGVSRWPVQRRAFQIGRAAQNYCFWHKLSVTTKYCEIFFGFSPPPPLHVTALLLGVHSMVTPSLRRDQTGHERQLPMLGLTLILKPPSSWSERRWDAPSVRLSRSEVPGTAFWLLWGLPCQFPGFLLVWLIQEAG